MKFLLQLFQWIINQSRRSTIDQVLVQYYFPGAGENLK